MVRRYFCFLGLAVLMMIGQAARAQEVLDKIVAVIDDNIILLSDLNQYATEFAMRSGVDPRKDPDRFDQIRSSMLENLVLQKVMLVQAQEDSVTVDERQVDKLLGEQINAMVQQIGSEEKLEEYFGTSMRKIRSNFRKEIRERSLVEALQQKRFGNIPISRREVTEFFESKRDSLPELPETVKLSHILYSVKPSAAAKAEALAKITEVQKKLNAGGDFAALAKEYSDDPGSASRGGDLGFTQRGDFVREFEEKAFSMSPGDISDIVETTFGYHIIQLIERRGERIHTRHILAQIPRSAADEETTKLFLDSLKQEIVAGKISFEAAAKRFSEDETTREKGGDLGWFELTQLQVKEFKEVAEFLPVGQISDPIRTQFGFHLVRVDARNEARSLSLDSDWEQIRNMAQQYKREKELRAWVDEIKKNMYIKINL